MKQYMVVLSTGTYKIKARNRDHLDYIVLMEFTDTIISAEEI